MRTKEQVEELVVSTFGEFANAKTNLTAVMSWQRRDIFLKKLRVVFSDLRLPYSLKAANLKEFSEVIFAEELKKQQFFENVLRKINEVSKKNYAPDSIILEEKDANSLEFFFDFSKIIDALGKEYKFSTSYALLEKCRTPNQLADVYYRRGRF
ncbi:MAG: hypothetical protein IJ479_08460 [Alphaproteobacteria bacterium]|nr:hypothetical protein [Alphaproteobacteria bacterium]